MIELDGSYGEGGGQLVRTAVALSAVTGKTLRLCNVRASRPRPGLAAQHLAAVRAVAALCEARCQGVEPGASAFTFEPQVRPAGGELRVDVGTAGSVTLVLQALLPVLLAARQGSRVLVVGGTDVRQAPTWDYFRHVLLGLLGRMGVQVRPRILRRGYYPRGGGEVELEVEPGLPAATEFRASLPVELRGQALVAHLPLAIAERMRAAALGALGNAPLRIVALGPEEAVGAGGSITLWAESAGRVLGASRVAERGVRAETLGEAAGAELAADLAAGAALDLHATDQILVYMAMAKGLSTFTTRAVSRHAETAMWLLAQFLPVRFVVEPEGALWRVSSRPV